MKLRVALVILYDSEKRFLLQHRSTDAVRLPNYWAFFGGGIKEGETPEDALRREAFEELNYELKAPHLVVKQDFRLDNAEGYMYVFIDAFYGDKNKLKLQEGQGWGWFKEKKIRNLRMTDHDREVIRLITQYLRGT